MPDSILPKPFAQPADDDPETRDFVDPTPVRSRIYQGVLEALQKAPEVSNDRYTLRLIDPHYVDPEKFSRRDQKRALLAGETVGRRVRGTWELIDRSTGATVDRRRQIVARVPFYTHRGTVIQNGNEYLLRHQQRLLPGVYARTRNNGELEAHVNFLPGKGLSHHYLLDPAQGVFRLHVRQADVPLLPLLRALGADDKEVEEAWGPKLFAANYPHADPAVLKQVARQFLKAKDRDAPDEATLRQRLLDEIGRWDLDPAVTRRTLGRAHTKLTKDAILDATKKLLAVTRGEADEDDRDHLAYQLFLGPEDLFRERIERDQGGLRKKLLYAATRKGNLAGVPSGALTPQLENALFGSGLGQTPEEVNPLELFDRRSSVTRLGAGGISSLDSVPDSARDVSSSHFGFIDAWRTPESLSAGIDLNMARGARKGKDGKLYAQFWNPRTRRLEWRTPQDLADAAIAFPGGLRSPDRFIPAIIKGKMGYIDKSKVDFALPHFEDAFSPMANLVPMKSMVKGQRVAMAARMTTQALPLLHAETPLVQGALPGSNGQRSFEEEYGRQAGARFADQDGRVLGYHDDTLSVQYADGTRDDIELYRDFPFARKTGLHQTPLVAPGQRFRAGDPLIRSNYTDDRGRVAVGVNARVAYMPFGGLNYEDASVISESMAERLSSEHYYHEGLEVDDRTRTGKKSYVSLFPARFDKATLAKLDEEGIVKPGTTVRHGDPLILGARQREDTANKIHRRGEAGFSDATVLWEHDDEGVVTDVAQGKDGPVVVVKAKSAMRVGDKLCFDPETRILTTSGWKPVALVTTDDEVATLNPETEELEWQRPTHVWCYQHTGLMYRLATKHIDMLVTPEHRLWVARPGGTYQPVTAADFYASCGEWQFKKDCKWAGSPAEWFDFPDPPRAYAARTQTLRRVKMDDWVEFLGYYLAEGWSDGRYVKIGKFRKSPAWAAVDALLGRLGLRYRYNDADGRFEVGNVWFAELLAPLGDSYTKRIPAYVQALPPRQLRIFFDAYMAGDGHKGACWEYSSSSESLTYDLQLVCLKLGWAVTVVEVTRDDNWSRRRHWRGRVNRKHLRPWWRKRRAKQYATVEEGMVEYSGDVYCVTVPNHVVYVERRGKTYWSLNSGRYG